MKLYDFLNGSDEDKNISIELVKRELVENSKNYDFTTVNFLNNLAKEGYYILNFDETKIKPLQAAFKANKNLFPVTFMAIENGKVDYKKLLETNYNLPKLQQYYFGLLKNIDLKPFDSSVEFMEFVRSHYNILTKQKLLDKRKTFNIFTFRDMIDTFKAKATYTWGISYERFFPYLYKNDKKGLEAELERLRH